MLADLTLSQLNGWLAYSKAEPFGVDDLQWGLTRAIILSAAGAKDVNPLHQTVAHLLTAQAIARDPASIEAFEAALRPR